MFYLIPALLTAWWIHRYLKADALIIIVWSAAWFIFWPLAIFNLTKE